MMTPGSAGDAKSPRDGPRVAIGSWAFSFGPFSASPWDFERVARFAADAGYDGIEINGFRPHPHDADYSSPERCAALLRMLRTHGLEISAYAPDFHGTPPGEAPLEQYLSRLDAVLAFCQRMGIRCVRTDTVSPPDELPPDEFERRLRHLVTAFRHAASRCERADVYLVWEFEPGFWLNRPSQVLRLLREVDHPHFRVLFDTAHAYTGSVAGARHGRDPELLQGGAAEYAAAVAPWLGHLHLSDSNGSLHEGETSDHLPFGTGEMDFPAVLGALLPDVLELPWWTVDLCFCPTAPQEARPSLEIVRSLLSKLSNGRSAEPQPAARGS
jgi:sugar phosphate isomerase/epimerase